MHRTITLPQGRHDLMGGLRRSYYAFTPDKQREFLQALTFLGDVNAACDHVKVRRHSVDRARRDDAEFRAAWADAIARAFSERVNGLAVGA